MPKLPRGQAPLGSVSIVQAQGGLSVGGRSPGLSSRSDYKGMDCESLVKGGAGRNASERNPQGAAERRYRQAHRHGLARNVLFTYAKA